MVGFDQGQAQSLSQTHAQTQMQAQAAGYDFGANQNVPSRGGMSIGFNAPFGASSAQDQVQQSTMDATVAAELNSLRAQSTNANASQSFGQSLAQGSFNSPSHRPLNSKGKDPFAYEDSSATSVTPSTSATSATPAKPVDSMSVTYDAITPASSVALSSRQSQSSGMPFPTAAPTLATDPFQGDKSTVDPLAYRDDYTDKSNVQTTSQESEQSAIKSTSGLNIVNVATEATAHPTRDSVQGESVDKASSEASERERELAEARASFFAALDKPISEVKNIKPLGLDGGIRPVYRSMFTDQNFMQATNDKEDQDSRSQEYKTELPKVEQDQTELSKTEQDASSAIGGVATSESSKDTPEFAEFSELDKKYLFEAVAQGRDEGYAEAERLIADFNLSSDESKLLYKIVATMLEQHESISHMHMLIAEKESHYREILQGIESVKYQIMQEDARAQNIAALRQAKSEQSNARAQSDVEGAYRNPNWNVQSFGQEPDYDGYMDNIDYSTCPDFDDIPCRDECPDEYRTVPSTFTDPEDAEWAERYLRSQDNSFNQGQFGNGRNGQFSNAQNVAPNFGFNREGNLNGFNGFNSQNSQGGQVITNNGYAPAMQTLAKKLMQQNSGPANPRPQEQWQGPSNWSGNNGQGSQGDYGSGNFNQGGQANHSFGHNGFNSYEQNEVLDSSCLNNGQQSDNSPQGRNYFRPQKVDPTLGQGNFNNLATQASFQGEVTAQFAQVEDLSLKPFSPSPNGIGMPNEGNCTIMPSQSGLHAMSSDMGRNENVQLKGGQGKEATVRAGELDLSEIFPNNVDNLEQRILEKGALQYKHRQDSKQYLKEEAAREGVTETQLTLDLDPEKYDIDGLPYDDFAKYNYDEPLAYPESLSGSGRSMNEIGLGPEGGVGEGFNLPSKQQRAQEAARQATLKATMPDSTKDKPQYDKAESGKSDSGDKSTNAKHEQSSQSVLGDEGNKADKSDSQDKSDSAAQSQLSKGDVYTGRKTNLPQAENYGNLNLREHAVSSIDLQNSSLEEDLNLNLRPSKVIDDELEDREFFTKLFSNLADFIYGMHQAKNFICTENVNIRTDSKKINSVLDNLADDMIRARDIQLKLASGEISRQEAEIAMGRLTKEQLGNAQGKEGETTSKKANSNSSTDSINAAHNVEQTDSGEFSLSQQGVGGMDVNDPRYLGAKLMGSVSLQAQRDQAKDGERSAVDPEGLISVPDFSATKPLVLEKQETIQGLTQDIRSDVVSTERLNENQSTGGTLGETPQSHGENLTLGDASVPKIETEESSSKQPDTVSDLSSDFNPLRAQTSQLGRNPHEGESLSKRYVVNGEQEANEFTASAKSSKGASKDSSSNDIVERKQILELTPQKNAEPNPIEMFAIKKAEFDGENEKAKVLRQQQAQNSLNSLVSSIRTQEGHGDFNIDDIFGSSLSDDKPVKLTFTDEFALVDDTTKLGEKASDSLEQDTRTTVKLKQVNPSNTIAQYQTNKDLPPWELESTQEKAKVESAQGDNKVQESKVALVDKAPQATKDTAQDLAKPSAGAKELSCQEQGNVSKIPQESKAPQSPSGGFLPPQNKMALASSGELKVGLTPEDSADRCAVNLGQSSGLVKWGSESNSLPRDELGNMALESYKANEGGVLQGVNTNSQVASTQVPVVSASSTSTKRPEPPTLRSLFEKTDKDRQGSKGKASGKRKDMDELDSFGILNAIERQMDTEMENKVVYAPSPWSLVQSAVIQIGDCDVPLSHMDMPAPVPINRNNQIGNLHKFEEEVPFHTAYMDSNVGFNVSLQDLSREVQSSEERFRSRLASNATHKQEWGKWRQGNPSLGKPDVRGEYYLNAGNAAKLSELQVAYNEYMRTYSNALGQASFNEQTQVSQAQVSQGQVSQANMSQIQNQGTTHIAKSDVTSLGTGDKNVSSQVEGEFTESVKTSAISEPQEYATLESAQKATELQPQVKTEDYHKRGNATDAAWDQVDYDDYPEQAGGHTTQEAYRKALEALDQHDSDDDDSTEHTNFTSMELDVDAFKEEQAQSDSGVNQDGEPNALDNTDLERGPKNNKLKFHHYDEPGMRLLNQDDYLLRLSENDEWYKLILAAFPDKGLFYGLLVNVERQIDPQDQYHWRLIVDKEQEIGGFADKIWKDVQERLEQHLQHKLNLEFEYVTVPSPRCPASLADSLANQAIVNAKQNLQASKGLNQLMQMMGENMSNVGVELYVAADKQLVKR